MINQNRPALRLVWVCFLLMSMSACGRHVALKALEPAGIPRATTIKRLSVTPLAHDRLNIGSQLEVKLASVMIEGSPYFTVISRDNLKAILREQRLQSSGLLDPKQAVALGELLGAHAIIGGAVGPQSAQLTRYYKEQERCTDPRCTDEKKIRVACVKLSAHLGIQLKLVDVRAGDIIYGHDDHLRREWSHCTGELGGVPSEEEALLTLSRALIERFVSKLAPRYVTYYVTILEEPIGPLSASAQAQFEGAVAFLEAGRFERAQLAFEGLVEGEGAESVAALYNLGLALEAQGDLKGALRLYQLADQRSTRPIDELFEALSRVQKRLRDQGELHKQLKGG